VISLERRGRIWYAVGQVNGRRIHQSLRTGDRTTAEDLKRDIELQLLSGGRLRKIAWKDYCDEFLRWITPQVKSRAEAGSHSTLEKYSFVLARFDRFASANFIKDLSQIQPATIAEYVRERGTDKHPKRQVAVGQETLKADLRILHLIFAYAVECGYMAANPVRYKRLNTTGGKTMPFSDEEIGRILDERYVRMWPQLRATILAFLFTGLRISDVRRLPLAALDLQNGWMVVKTRKRGKTVSMAIHPELKAALEEHLASRTLAQQASPYVFSTRRGKPAQSLDASIRRVCQRCGIANGHPHRFRDTFAVRLLAQGASLYDVAKLLGITTATAERHYSPYVRELRERGARLIGSLTVPTAEEKVVQFCMTDGPREAQNGQMQGEVADVKRAASAGGKP